MLAEHKKQVIPSDISLNRCVEIVNLTSRRLGELCLLANSPWQHVSVANEGTTSTLRRAEADDSTPLLSVQEQKCLMQIEAAKEAIAPVIKYIEARKQDELARRSSTSTNSLSRTRTHTRDEYHQLYRALGTMHRWLVHDDGPEETHEQRSLQKADETEEKRLVVEELMRDATSKEIIRPGGRTSLELTNSEGFSIARTKQVTMNFVALLVDRREEPYSYESLLEIINSLGLLSMEMFPYECFTDEGKQILFEKGTRCSERGKPPIRVAALAEGPEGCPALAEALTSPPLPSIERISPVPRARRSSVRRGTPGDCRRSPSRERSISALEAQGRLTEEDALRAVRAALTPSLCRSLQEHARSLIHLWAQALATYFLHCELMMQLEVENQIESRRRLSQTANGGDPAGGDKCAEMMRRVSFKEEEAIRLACMENDFKAKRDTLRDEQDEALEKERAEYAARQEAEARAREAELNSVQEQLEAEQRRLEAMKDEQDAERERLREQSEASRREREEMMREALEEERELERRAKALEAERARLAAEEEKATRARKEAERVAAEAAEAQRAIDEAERAQAERLAALQRQSEEEEEAHRIQSQRREELLRAAQDEAEEIARQCEAVRLEREKTLAAAEAERRAREEASKARLEAEAAERAQRARLADLRREADELEAMREQLEAEREAREAMKLAAEERLFKARLEQERNAEAQRLQRIAEAAAREQARLEEERQRAAVEQRLAAEAEAERVRANAEAERRALEALAAQRAEQEAQLEEARRKWQLEAKERERREQVAQLIAAESEARGQIVAEEALERLRTKAEQTARALEADQRRKERVAAEIALLEEGRRRQQELEAAERQRAAAEAERLCLEREAAEHAAQERRREAERFQRERDAAEKEVEERRREAERLQREREAAAREAQERRKEAERLRLERAAAARELEAQRFEAERQIAEAKMAQKRRLEEERQLAEIRARAAAEEQRRAKEAEDQRRAKEAEDQRRAAEAEAERRRREEQRRRAQIEEAQRLEALRELQARQRYRIEGIDEQNGRNKVEAEERVDRGAFEKRFCRALAEAEEEARAAAAREEELLKRLRQQEEEEREFEEQRKRKQEQEENRKKVEFEVSNHSNDILKRIEALERENQFLSRAVDGVARNSVAIHRKLLSADEQKRLRWAEDGGSILRERGIEQGSSPPISAHVQGQTTNDGYALEPLPPGPRNSRQEFSPRAAASRAQHDGCQIEAPPHPHLNETCSPETRAANPSAWNEAGQRSKMRRPIEAPEAPPPAVRSAASPSYFSSGLGHFAGSGATQRPPRAGAASWKKAEDREHSRPAPGGEIDNRKTFAEYYTEVPEVTDDGESASRESRVENSAISMDTNNGGGLCRKGVEIAGSTPPRAQVVSTVNGGRWQKDGQVVTAEDREQLWHSNKQRNAVAAARRPETVSVLADRQQGQVNDEIKADDGDCITSAGLSGIRGRATNKRPFSALEPGVLAGRLAPQAVIGGNKHYLESNLGGWNMYDRYGSFQSCYTSTENMVKRADSGSVRGARLVHPAGSGTSAARRTPLTTPGVLGRCGLLASATAADLKDEKVREEYGTAIIIEILDEVLQRSTAPPPSDIELARACIVTSPSQLAHGDELLATARSKAAQGVELLQSPCKSLNFSALCPWINDHQLFLVLNSLRVGAQISGGCAQINRSSRDISSNLEEINISKCRNVHSLRVLDVLVELIKYCPRLSSVEITAERFNSGSEKERREKIIAIKRLLAQRNRLQENK